LLPLRASRHSTVAVLYVVVDVKKSGTNREMEVVQ